jgi:hypothetical protein
MMGSKLSLVNSLLPHAAGNIFPAYSKGFGSIFMGNMIPDSIIDGRKMICETMVSFDWDLHKSPKTHPILNDTATKTAREPK